MNPRNWQVPLILLALLICLGSVSQAQSAEPASANAQPVLQLRSSANSGVIEEITPAVLAQLAAQRRRHLAESTPAQLIAQTSPAPPSQRQPQNEQPLPLPQSSQPAPGLPASPEPQVAGSDPNPQLAARYVTARFPYSSRDKFHLFVRDIYNPFGLVGEGFNALVAQAEDEPPQFRGGMLGFGKRFGAIVATDTTGGFFGTFLFPSVLHTDPRYFRRGEGGFTRRAVYAMSRIFIVRKDSGGNTLNAAGWLSSFATTAVSNTYYPDRHRGFGPTLEHATVNTGYDGLYNLFREFWPDIAHGLHIPVFVIRRTADPTFPAQPSTAASPSQK